MLLYAPVGYCQTSIESPEIQSQLPAQQIAQVSTPTPSAEPEGELEITVIGTRTRRALKDSPSMVSVQDRQDLDRKTLTTVNSSLGPIPG